MVVGFRFIGARFFWREYYGQSYAMTEVFRHICMWVGSRLGSYRVSGFLLFLLGFYLRRMLPIPMEPAPLMQALYTFVHSGLYSHVLLFIIILFILCWFIYLSHLALRTHVLSCVRGRIVALIRFIYFEVWH
jgi:hypothetical protein